MRPFHLNLAAVGLVALSVFMIIHRPEKEAATISDEMRPLRKTRVAQVAIFKPDANEAAAAGGAEAEPVRPDRPETPLVARRSSANIAEPSGAFGAATNLPDSANDAAGRATLDSGHITGVTNSKSQDRAIQLGDDVRLPAAIIALNDPEATAGEILPTVAAATREIENTFYRELAEKTLMEPSVVKDSTVLGSNATAQVPPAATDETEVPDTVVLSEHDVYDARERADAVYRTIHGDEAAKRRGISGALEVRLPKDAGTAQP